MAGRILISGATGLIGGHFASLHRQRGGALRCLTRSAANDSSGTPGDGEIPPEWCEWDGVSLPAAALDDCTDVIHLSGEPVFGGRLSVARKQRIEASRVESTRSIVEVIRALPADRRPSSFICASAVGFYGSRTEETLDEAATAGEGFLAQLCRKWEATAREAEDLGVRVVSLRIGIVLARESGALPMMALPFRFGLGGRMGDGRQWVPWIHIDDVVGILDATLRDTSYRGPVNAVSPNPVRNAELTTALSQTLRRPALLPVPAFALRLLLGELGDELLGSQRCVPGEVLRRGFEFAHTEIETALDAELLRR